MDEFYEDTACAERIASCARSSRAAVRYGLAVFFCFGRILKRIFWTGQVCLMGKHGIFPLCVVLNAAGADYSFGERREMVWTRNGLGIF